VLLVQAGNPSWWTGPTGNNTYLLTGSVPTLIDAGVGNPDHLDAIRTALGSTALALVLITHSHTDHVAGVAALRERWPGVDVRQFGVGSHPLQPDERVRAGDGDLVVVHTPGHSPDHAASRAAATCSAVTWRASAARS
jgi:glyoxylase-like metal-dependent hydrolase (beta-lactamase superfamily II)